MRENIIWIDRVKIFACISVVISHLIGGIVGANIIKPSYWSSWIEYYLYLFHVPLFFICSGYLYQKYNLVINKNELRQSLKRKFLNLSIPYFTFSIATLLLKVVFSGSVNNVETGVIKILLFSPTAPYWYLYVLFFFFAVTLTIKTTKQGYILFLISIIFKLFISGLFDLGIKLDLDIIEKFMYFYFWFISGMILANNQKIEKFLHRISLYQSIGIMVLTTILSIILFYQGYTSEFVKFLLSILLCSLICSIFMKFKLGKLEKIVKYTMPIFLMHTISAAGMRSILLYFGIENIIVHIIIGFSASIIIPIIIAIILEKTVYLNILLYPVKTIKEIKQTVRGKNYELQKNHS